MEAQEIRKMEKEIEESNSQSEDDWDLSKDSTLARIEEIFVRCPRHRIRTWDKMDEEYSQRLKRGVMGRLNKRSLSVDTLSSTGRRGRFIEQSLREYLEAEPKSEASCRRMREVDQTSTSSSQSGRDVPVSAQLAETEATNRITWRTVANGVRAFGQRAGQIIALPFQACFGGGTAEPEARPEVMHEFIEMSRRCGPAELIENPQNEFVATISGSSSDVSWV